MGGRAVSISLIAASVSGLVLAASPSASAPSLIEYRNSAREHRQGESPRRPPSKPGLPVYYERPGTSAPWRQGTAFIVDPQGAWATAAHVTDGCAVIRLLVHQRAMPPIPAPVRAIGGDMSLIVEGARAATALEFARHMPKLGSVGYHMGFPMGSPGVVGSRLLGQTSAVRHAGQTDPVLAWVEDWRTREGVAELDGLSGGPVMNDQAQVVGIVSMVSERRGRILTAMPTAFRRRLSAEGMGVDARFTSPIGDRKAAISRFQFFLNNGLIRQIYCDVAPPRK